VKETVRRRRPFIREHHPDRGGDAGAFIAGMCAFDAEQARWRPPVGFQNSATVPDLGFYVARLYSLMRPPRTEWRLICFWMRSATGCALQRPDAAHERDSRTLDRRVPARASRPHPHLE
jgi:hypothetical protein